MTLAAIERNHAPLRPLDRSWMPSASCRTLPWDTLRPLEALDVCRRCPVIDACRQYAADARMTWLVVAGHNLRGTPLKAVTQ